jgi:hypothetical protein
MNRTSVLFLMVSTVLSVFPSPLLAMDACRKLPSKIKVVENNRRCGGTTVVLRGKWKDSFSSVFRWDDGSDEGQDRSPFALDDSSAESSPYKIQRRIQKPRKDLLCYGNFLNRNGYPEPEQITIKRSANSQVDRFCVSFE